MIGFLIALGVALVLDLLLGDPHSSFHPVALFGRAAGGVETLPPGRALRARRRRR